MYLLKERMKTELSKYQSQEFEKKNQQIELKKDRIN